LRKSFLKKSSKFHIPKFRMALHACLGGTPVGFHVQFLRDHHYRISVASKRVGFAVTDPKRITTLHFDVYLHLWQDGGKKTES
jgi:hypothetical protein